jgi:uncharacterized membrane protein
MSLKVNLNKKLNKFKYLFKIKTYKKNNTNSVVEITTNSDFFEELFLTKKEKKNNAIYNINYSIYGTIAMIFAFVIGYKLENYLHISLGIFDGCLMLVIIFVIFAILTPFFEFLEKKLVTKIKNIKLIFSSNGLKIIPDSPKKEPIYIESLNIADIYLKEDEIVVESSKNSYYKKNILNLILKLHKPITNQFTNKEIKELILIEKIDKEFYLEESIEVAKEMKKILDLTQ